MGYNPNIIDIGGGLSHQVSIDEYGKFILSTIKDYGLENVKIISEPGRFISSVAFSYVANIISKHKREKANLIYYTLDNGIHGNMAFVNYLENLLNVFHLILKIIKNIEVLWEVKHVIVMI